MTEIFLGLLKAGLDLYNGKEKNKYKDSFLKLEKAYWDEINKPEGERNDAAIDDIEFDLKNLATAFIQAASGAQ